jgi:hypothetical protein
LRRFLVLALILAALPLRAAEWTATRAPGVVIYTQGTNPALAGALAAMVGRDLPRIAGAIGLAKAGPYPVFAYSHRTDFYRDAGKNPYLEGVSYQPSGMIRLDATGPTWALQPTLAHELTHSALNQRLGYRVGRLPEWVNEGLAGHLSEPTQPDQYRAIAKLTHRNGVLSLAELKAAFDNPDLTDAGYLQSRAMMAWLESRHPGAIRGLIDGLAAGRDFDDALYAATGLTAAAWWEGWHAEVPGYLYWLLLLNSPVAYAPIALLFILFAALHLRRRAQQAEEETPPAPPTPTEEDDEYLEEWEEEY